MVLGNIFDIVDASDKYFDSKLLDNEIDILIKQIEGINKVEINDELARKMIIGSWCGTNAVMKFIKIMIDDDPLTGPQGAEKCITFLWGFCHLLYLYIKLEKGTSVLMLVYVELA